MGLTDIINRIKSMLGLVESGGRRGRPPRQGGQSTQAGRGGHQDQEVDQGHQHGDGEGTHQEARKAAHSDGFQSDTDGDTVDVTVEREPDTRTEDAVKGTNTAPEGEPVTESIAAEEVQNGTGASDAETVSDSPADAEEANGGVTVETDDASADGSEAVTESVTEATGAADEQRAGTDESVDVIKGIGPTYADRLAGAGIETVADLAASDASDVADRADVPRGRLENWIERARHR